MSDKTICADTGVELLTFEIPFMGFYETVLDMHLQNELEQSEIDIDAVDWNATRQRIALAYAEIWLFRVGLTGVFVELISPKEYNFLNDRLVVQVEHNFRLAEYADAIGSRDFAAWVKENYSTRSGFVSFVKPVAEWPAEHGRKEFTLLFQYLEQTEWPEMPEQIIEELACNGGFELIVRGE